MEGDPVNHALKQIQHETRGPLKSIHTTVYELDSPTGERAPMYYNDSKFLATDLNKQKAFSHIVSRPRYQDIRNSEPAFG